MTEPRAGEVGRIPARDALLVAAEQALARGDTAVAIRAFERAALMLHAADTEMGQVRAAMQAGDYRHALAFCAHTAGAHLDAPAAAALYAWLLQLGGQEAVAQRVLAGAVARAPGDAVLQAAQQAMARPSTAASGVLLDLPQRMAPLPVMLGAQRQPDTGARGAASGVLLADGQRALVPAAAIAGARRLWVRNGLGQTTEARVAAAHDGDAGLGVAVLRLDAPLDAGDAQVAARDPFAGSPGYAVEYGASDDAAPAWPRLSAGFFGGFDGASGLRKPGMELPAGPHGGPLFDAAGRFAGMVLPQPGGDATMLPVSMLRALLPSEQAGEAPAPAARPAARMPPDEAYERALRQALQVIVLP